MDTDRGDDQDQNEALEYATMDDDERKRFAGIKEAGGQPGQPRALRFDDPRDADHMGTDPQPDSDEARQEERDEMDEAGGAGEGTRRQGRDRN